MACLPGGWCHRVCRSAHQSLCGNLGENAAEELRDPIPKPSNCTICRKLTDRLEADIHQHVHSFTPSFIRPSPLRKQIFRGTARGEQGSRLWGHGRTERHSPCLCSSELAAEASSGAWRVPSSEEMRHGRCWVGGAQHPGDLPECVCVCV